MPRTSKSRTCLVVTISLLAAACGRSDLNTTAPSYAVDRRYVTGEAAAAIDKNGKVMLRNLAAADGSEITEGRAVQLAIAYLHDFGELGASTVRIR